MSDVAATIARRDAIALLSAIAATACSATRPPSAPSVEAAAEPFTVDPLVDLVPAAGLRWLAQVRPRTLLADAAVASAIATLVPEEAFVTFALRHGGVDLRMANEVVVAGVDDACLALARLPVDPASIEAAFARRALAVDGRAVERGITRFWGTVGETREQVAVFGRSAVGMEQGRFGPLGVATYFAQGRLRRSRPALHGEPLEAAAARLGQAPIRTFAPGPFEGAWAGGWGGLLGASTAAAMALRPQPAAGPRPSGGIGGNTGGQEGSERVALGLRIVLMGAWSNDGAAAAERMGAAYRVLTEDALGRLAGLLHPVEPPKVIWDAAALQLDVTLDAFQLARGVSAIISGSLREILAL
jgi:hypothetical protein